MDGGRGYGEQRQRLRSIHARKREQRKGWSTEKVRERARVLRGVSKAPGVHAGRQGGGGRLGRARVTRLCLLAEVEEDPGAPLRLGQ